ncbi:MAG: glycosyltransferase family 1 protein [Candidatus Shapirobacteria bacterium]|nr:glycosyltransferase family 1 protein [Candidatus Shapirobacteria bacterium]
MKIVIDARMYGLEHAGIGRYLVNLINQIEKEDKENKYFILLREKYFHELNFKNNNFKKILADYPHYSFQEQILLPIQLIKLKPDLVHFPHFNVPLFYFGKYVVTIHDLIKHESRGMATTTRFSLFYWLKYMVYLSVVWLAVKRAVKIITPSKFWQEELVKRYNLPKNKIVVTYEGVDEKLLQSKTSLDSKNVLAKYKIKTPFVVCTGSLYPHKNVERLVMAVKKINQDLKLVIVCARNIFYDRFLEKIKKLQAEKFVNLVGFVPDEDLAALYNQAEAFVFPSFWEGFGLPGLEAMALGLPVISSNSSCLPEVYGEAALYFNPSIVEEIAEKIKMVIGDTKIRATLIKKGFEQVKKYSWEKMARETLLVYQRVLSRAFPQKYP